MKYKRWLVYLGFILLLFSQSQIGKNLIYQSLGNYAFKLSPYLAIPISIVLEGLSGAMSIVNSLWNFLLSLNGVLLIGFILIYKACKNNNFK